MKNAFWLLLLWSSLVLAENATVPVEQASLPLLHPLTGRVEAVNQATMTAQTSGRIAELYFDVNDLVKKGEPLARLRNEQQKADLDMATAGLAEARAELDRAQSEFKRISDLYDRQLIARVTLDQAQAAQKTAQARLSAAQARVSSAEENYGYTLIRAPYSGIVTKRHVEVGESVRPGSPLVSGITLDQLRVAVEVPQTLVIAVRSHKKAIVDISPEQHIVADKITIFPYADELTHGFTARIELPRGVEGLFPGMLVTVNFVTGEDPSLLVPQQALVNRGELTAVYVRYADGRIAMRQVRTGRADDGKRVIHAGLSAGEQVFVDPQLAVVEMKQQQAQKN
jgi:RND family efflux transporter MFP subunit